MAESVNLIIVPAPGLGHLVSIVEFANILLRHDDRFSVFVLVINPPFGDEGLLAKRLSDAHPAISFIDVPRVDPSPLLSGPPMMPEAFISSYIALHKANVRAAVAKLGLLDKGAWMRFVIDMFCSSMLDVARGFDSPCYTFFTSGAAFLGLIQFMSTRGVFSEAEPEPDSLISAYAHPVPASVLPGFFFRKDGYDAFAAHGKRIRETDGVVINTFTDLEPHALSSFGEGHPPLYPIGPVLDLTGANQASETKRAERLRIFKWLDEQEEESVVFLCFGSMGTFKADQVAEIAAGLENSGVKFLWALRRPPQEGKDERTTDYEDLNEILPDGFLARTEGRGLVCGWAPQVEILAHKSVGGFVTHCGWNSTLESIWFGVPTVAWPQYAEQQVNAFQMVKDLGLAIELRIDYRRNQPALVSAAEVENAVKLLMAVDGYGREMRKRVKEMSERSRAAVVEGGFPFETVGKLITKLLD